MDEEEEEVHTKHNVGVIASKPKDYNIDEDDDLTTEIKQTDIDPTTTTDEEDGDDLGRQLHGFYFYLIWFYFSFLLTYDIFTHNLFFGNLLISYTPSSPLLLYLHHSYIIVWSSQKNCT